jgi:type VI secretion system secreted protein Hcp
MRWRGEFLLAVWCVVCGVALLLCVRAEGGTAAAPSGVPAQLAAGQAAAPAGVTPAPSAPAKVLLHTPTASPAPEPGGHGKIYMTISGVPGEAKGGKIQVETFQMDAAAPRDLASGQASGKRSHGSIMIMKRMDKSSPALMHAAALGKQFPSVIFEFVQPTARRGEQTHKTTKLVNVLITRVRTLGGGNAPAEEVTFTYEKIE